MSIIRIDDHKIRIQNNREAFKSSVDFIILNDEFVNIQTTLIHKDINNGEPLSVGALIPMQELHQAICELFSSFKAIKVVE